MLLSELLGLPVVDEGGRRLGVIHDVQAVQDGPVTGGFGAALRVESLIVGRHGLTARIGLSPAHVKGPGPVRWVASLRGGRQEIPWDAVRRIDDDQVLVHASPR